MRFRLSSSTLSNNQPFPPINCQRFFLTWKPLAAVALNSLCSAARPGFFVLCLLDEAQRNRVHAVAQAGRLRPVVEDVP